MTRSIAMSLLVCGALGANAAPSYADTITLDGAGGNLAMGATVSLTGGMVDAVSRTIPTLGFGITGACGAGAIYGCLTIVTGDTDAPDSTAAAADLDEYLSIGLSGAGDVGTGASITDGGGVSSESIQSGTSGFTGFFDPNVNVGVTFAESTNLTTTWVDTPAQGASAPVV